MNEGFWAKLYCKLSDSFRKLLLALRLSTRRFDIKKNLWWCPLKDVDQYKKVIFEIILSKKEFKYEILNHLYFGPNFIF